MQNSFFMPSSKGDFYWVHGEESAKIHPMQAGTTALFLDTEDPVFYIKTLDIQGKVSNFEIYDYTKREQPAPPTYATKDDIDNLATQFSALKKMLEDLTAPST